MIRSLALLCLLWLAGGVPAAGAQGRIVTATLPSQALLGNRIGDSVDRPITVYLPPSYDQAPSRRYPVLYLLHGATSVPVEWLDGTYQGMDLRAALDQQAAQGEFLVVMPMADNRFGGSFYVDSPAFGHWDAFVARELVDFIDRRFRTLPLRRYRGLAGHSMGGFGALSVAGRHPGVFGHVYAASPCCLALVGDLARDGERWQRPLGGWLRAMAMAFDPDPRGAGEDAAPPLPFAPGADGSMHAVPTVMARWQRELPLARLARDPAPYRQLCSLALDAGRQDQIPSVPLGAAAFAAALTRAGVPHAFTLYDGDHVDHVRDRFEQHLLPFFARAFARAGTRRDRCR